MEGISQHTEPAVVGGRRRRGSLDRQQVVAAAETVLERVGLHQLTMRNVGTELGVQAMTLYRYVTGRDDLLNAVAAHLTNQLFDQPRPVNPPQWRRYLIELAADFRHLTLRHPQAAELLVTSQPAIVGVHLPFRTALSVETLLCDLQQCGLSDVATAAAYQLFCTCAMGRLVVDLTTTRTVTRAAVDVYPILSRVHQLNTETAADYDLDSRLMTLHL